MTTLIYKNWVGDKMCLGTGLSEITMIDIIRNFETRWKYSFDVLELLQNNDIQMSDSP